MKAVCISDTHTKHRELDIPKADVLIHAGDITYNEDLECLKDFVKWLDSLTQVKHKVVIAGNHDWDFVRNEKEAREILKGSCHYLQDSEIILEGVKFYGSPWQPEFCNWAFNLPRGLPLKEKWDMIPEDTDILITHGPPLGHGDRVKDFFSIDKYINVGCSELLKAVKRVKPKYHIFGHIHEGYGLSWEGSTCFVNASSCNERYKPINKPIEITI